MSTFSECVLRNYSTDTEVNFFSGFPRNLYQKTQDIFNYATRGIHDQYNYIDCITSVITSEINI